MLPEHGELFAVSLQNAVNFNYRLGLPCCRCIQCASTHCNKDIWLLLVLCTRHRQQTTTVSTSEYNSYDSQRRLSSLVLVIRKCSCFSYVCFIIIIIGTVIQQSMTYRCLEAIHSIIWSCISTYQTRFCFSAHSHPKASHIHIPTHIYVHTFYYQSHTVAPLTTSNAYTPNNNGNNVQKMTKKRMKQNFLNDIMSSRASMATQQLPFDLYTYTNTQTLPRGDKRNEGHMIYILLLCMQMILLLHIVTVHSRLCVVAQTAEVQNREKKKLFAWQ